MQSWLKVSLILCMFGFLKELRPSEYFIVEFYESPPMNFTSDVVAREFFPCSIYSNMVMLVIMFLVTDYFRYKPVIILHSISGIVVFIMLNTFRKIIFIKVAEVIYGVFLASEVAYNTYMYAKVEKEHYQEVTGYARAAVLLGTASSGLIGQLLVTNQLLTYYQLNFLNIGGLSLATLWAIFLPPVKESIYDKRKRETAAASSSSDPSSNYPTLVIGQESGAKNKSEDDSVISENTAKNDNARIYILMAIDLKHAFTNSYVLKWMFWSVVSTAVYAQVNAYSLILWSEVAHKDTLVKQELWNGAISSLSTIIGAVGTFQTGKLNLPWRFLGDYILSLNTLLLAVLVYTMVRTDSLLLVYAMYIALNVTHLCTGTIASSEIAKNLKENCFGLIFGVSTFLSQVLQSLLTLVLVDNGFKLPRQKQFTVYSGILLVLGCLFVFKSAINVVRTFCK